MGFDYYIFHMIRPIAYLCLLLATQASLIPQAEHQAHPENGHNAAAMPGLQAIQQNILKNYLQGPLYSTSDSAGHADEAPVPEGTIEAARSKHNQFIDSHFKNKDGQSVPSNIDQGTDNTIDGVHNIIESGTLNDLKGNRNILNGSKNSVNGSENHINGHENTIKSDKNVVHGDGNVIMDGPVSPIAIDIRKMPKTPKPQPSGSQQNSKEGSGSSIADSRTHLSTQFESYFALGVLLIALQLLL